MRPRRVDGGHGPGGVGLPRRDRCGPYPPEADAGNGVAWLHASIAHADLVGGREDVGEHENLFVGRASGNGVGGVVGDRDTAELGPGAGARVNRGPRPTPNAPAVAAFPTVPACADSARLRLSRDRARAVTRGVGPFGDGAGGPRIGGAFRGSNRGWSRRTWRSSAVVIVISAGWDRGDPALVATETARLRRNCHRLVWLNPLAGTPEIGSAHV